MPDYITFLFPAISDPFLFPTFFIHQKSFLLLLPLIILFHFELAFPASAHLFLNIVSFKVNSFRNMTKNERKEKYARNENEEVVLHGKSRTELLRMRRVGMQPNVRYSSAFRFFECELFSQYRIHDTMKQRI